MSGTAKKLVSVLAIFSLTIVASKKAELGPNFESLLSLTGDFARPL